MAFPPVAEQLRVIRRGIVDLVDERELAQRLEQSRASGKPLRVKLGIDPSSPDIHLGHTVVLRKLRDFQGLGHTACLLWGTATAMVGDPTGRNKTRPQLTKDQVAANQRTYKAQVGRILDLERVEESENGRWFDRMTFMDAVALAARYTVAQMLERDMFAARFREGLPIAIHELLYPLMQGQDSVELRADIELGGTDQLFNLLVGRELQRQAGQPPQICITTPILEGLDGVQKMSKSLGNYIGVLDPPSEMFGKAMSIQDTLMAKYFTLLTDTPQPEIDRLLAGHPREAKATLAAAIVRSLHGDDAARRARAEFDRVFQAGGLPDEIPTVEIDPSALRDGALPLLAALTLAGLAASGSDARRLLQGNGVRRDGEVVSDPNAVLRSGRHLLQVGKRRAAHVVVP